MPASTVPRLLAVTMLTAAFVWAAAAAPTSKFDPLDLASAVDFARAAYCEPHTVSSWNCGAACDAKPSFHLEKVVNNSATRVTVFMGYEPGDRAIVAAFRGTSTPLRWINSLRVAGLDDHPDPSCGGKVYATVQKEWQAMAYQVLKTLDELRHKYDDARIIFTGHGVGGSFATLAAIDCATHYTKDFVVYTFGEPRLGDRRFNDFAEKSLAGRRFRVTHGGDAVALLPPKSRDFHHFGQELWFPRGESTHKTCDVPPVGQDDTCSQGHGYQVAPGDEDTNGVADHLVYGGTCMDCHCDVATLTRKHNAKVAALVVAAAGEQAEERVGDL